MEAYLSRNPSGKQNMASTKIHKRILGLFLMVVALALFGVNGLMIYVATGPRSLNRFIPRIEAALKAHDGTYSVKIEDAQLVWEGWRHPIGVQVRGLTVLDFKGRQFASFPDITVRVYLVRLLAGELYVKSLEIMHPVVQISQSQDGNFQFGFNGSNSGAATQDQPGQSLDSVLTLLADGGVDDPLSHLEAFSILHATLQLKKQATGLLLQSPDLTVDLTRRHGRIKGTLTMPLTFGGKNAEVDGEFTVRGPQKTIEAQIVYTDIPFSIIAGFFPEQKWMNAIRMPISGWANVTSDFNATISSFDFTLDTGGGSVALTDQFEAPFAVQRIHVEGNLSDGLDTLKVKDGLLDLKKFQIAFSGAVNKQGSDYALDGKARTRNVPVDDLHLYWPLALSPHTRAWVGEHIRGGMMGKGEIEAHFKHGELKLKDTPDAAIRANLDVKGADVAYKPDHPPARNVTGHLAFTGNTMDARIAHADYMTGAVAENSRLWISDFAASDVRLFMDMNVRAPAGDVQHFLSLPDLNKAARLHLTPDITGGVTGNAKLNFIAFSDNDNDASNGRINYDISGHLDHVTQAGFLNKYDVADADLDIHVDNKAVTAKGAARANRVPVSVNVTSHFNHDHATEYAVKLDLPVERMPDFGLPKLNMLTGTMGVSASFVSSDTEETSHADIDLLHTAIALPEHGFEKKAGVPAHLSLATQRLPSGNTAFPSFSFGGERMEGAGKAEIEKGTGDFVSLGFDHLRFGENNIGHLDYHRIPGGFRVAAKGESMDASPYLGRKSKDTSGVMQLDIDAGRVALGEKREVKSARIMADCGEICRSVAIDADLADGAPLRYRIEDGKLAATCDNAGELLRTLGVFDSIKGGKMTLDGEYDAHGRIAGNFIMTDYTIVHAPLMTKIFTIASLTGIVDTISGNGIHFSKLTAPYIYHHGLILLKDAKTHGSALGITADGSVDTGARTFDLSGVLVPSYTINSLVGNLPLIGNLLIGGGGKGLIALNYSIKGDMADPSISVNPLSALTPGFMRGIFDIFDKKAPDMDAVEQGKKDAPPKDGIAAPAAPEAKPDAQKEPATPPVPSFQPEKKSAVPDVPAALAPSQTPTSPMAP